MGVMYNRNAHIGSVILSLIALAAVAAFQPGYGGTQDISEIRKAAERGDAKAQMRLGGAYAKGKWVPQDLVKAYAWLNLAAAQGSKLAVAVRDKLRPKMTAKQVAEAQKLATELWDRIESPKSK